MNKNNDENKPEECLHLTNEIFTSSSSHDKEFCCVKHNLIKKNVLHILSNEIDEE